MRDAITTIGLAIAIIAMAVIAVRWRLDSWTRCEARGHATLYCVMEPF